MTITSKDLSGHEAYTGVARDLHEKRLEELRKLQAEIDKFLPKSTDEVKEKSKQKRK